jgi:hypothetical protein
MAVLLSPGWAGWAIAAVFLITIIATAIGYYTRAGSGIDEHPVDDRGRSPGAKGPATVSGAGRTPEGTPGKRFSAPGTR